MGSVGWAFVLVLVAARRVVHKHHVQTLLKEAASRAGFNPEDFMSHSLWAGGASAMYHNGFTVEEIQCRGDGRRTYVRSTSRESPWKRRR